MGINGASNAGDDFIVLSTEKDAKNLADARIIEEKEGNNKLTLSTKDNVFSKKNTEELKIIIKSDVHGSSEAIKFALSNIKDEEVKIKYIII